MSISTTVNPYNSKNIMGQRISALSLQRKYYNSIKFMVHMTESRTKRKMMLSQIAITNPYLCAQIIMTICEDTREEEEYLLNSILYRSSRVTNTYKRMLLLMALVELGEYGIFEEEVLKNTDLLDAKTIRYFSNNFNARQQLALISALQKADMNNRIGAVIQGFEKKYSGEYEGDLIDLAKQLARSEQPQVAYRLLKAAGLDRDTASILESDKGYMEDVLTKKMPFSSSPDLELYLNLKYGLSSSNINNRSVWEEIMNKETFETYGTALTVFLRKLSKQKVLTVDVIKFLLSRFGIDEIYVNEENANQYLLSYLQRDTFHIEPFYTLMPIEEKMLELLNDTNFKNKYEFCTEDRLGINTQVEKRQMQEAYEYFDQCVSGYADPANLIRVYFNSPLKTSVNFEYLVKKLESHYNCDERKIRFLLGDFIFKGKVCRVNDKSVSIRAYNVWVSKPCRMNTLKYWVPDSNGNRHTLLEGDVLYFKFNYMTSDTEKINIHFPELSLESMKEKENVRRRRFD